MDAPVNGFSTNDSPAGPLKHLDPSLDHVPIEVFNALVDVVNNLYAAMADADARLKHDRNDR